MSVSVFPSNTAGNLAPYWYRVLLGRGVSHPLAHLTEAVGVRAEPVGARGRPGVREARCVRAVCTGPFPPRCREPGSAAERAQGRRERTRRGDLGLRFPGDK